MPSFILTVSLVSASASACSVPDENTYVFINLLLTICPNLY